MENPTAVVGAADTAQATRTAPEAPGQMASRPAPHSGAAGHATLPSHRLPDLPPRLLRDSVDSASEIPQKEIKAAVFSTHVASEQYVQHYRKAMASMREAHHHERQAWEVERQELLIQVAELEAKLERVHSAQDKLFELSSMKNKFSNYSIGSKTVTRSSSTPGDFANPTSARHSSLGNASLTNTGEEQGMGIRLNMQSIPEELESDRSKSVSFAAGRVPDIDINKALEHISIAGHMIDKDLDGINLKATCLPPTIKRAVLGNSQSGTPSPVFSPGAQVVDSPSLKRPVTIEITGQVLRLPAGELHRHGAGSTPLARLAESDDTSEANTGAATPRGMTAAVTETEKPPLEPHPSTADAKPIRPPNERSDSYFNVPPPAKEILLPDVQSSELDSVAVVDDDPELTGPLSMPNQPPPLHDVHSKHKGANEFLDKLSEKLTMVVKQQKSESATTDPEERTENDPPLRIRRSINFGSQLGQAPR